ncbi:hypothetical protein Hanom_Chr15g01355681 [Helianthus anomalus]
MCLANCFEKLQFVYAWSVVCYKYCLVYVKIYEIQFEVHIHINDSIVYKTQFEVHIYIYIYIHC